MAHDRKRQIEGYFSKLAQFSPIVGIFGHRQVGKSTFMAAQVNEYATLDDLETLEKAGQMPRQFLEERKHPFGIDECQIEPKLFPALKEKVRRHKRPGQFILSGSVRFTSRKAIRESLAGRLAFLEIVPFTVSEINEEPLSSVVEQLLAARTFTSHLIQTLTAVRAVHKIKKDFDHFLKFGGLPGLCFIRSEQLRDNRLKQLLELVLDRDLRMIVDTKLSLATLTRYLEELAKNAWQPYNAAAITRKLKLSHATQKRLLYALESIFLVRRIPLVGKRGEIVLMEDQFEEYFLSQRQLLPEQQIRGAFYRNIRTQWMYRLTSVNRVESYLTVDGARVDLVISSPDFVLGFKYIQGAIPTLSEKRSVGGFLKKYANSKIIYYSREIIQTEILDDRSLLCSLYLLI